MELTKGQGPCGRPQPGLCPPPVWVLQPQAVPGVACQPGQSEAMKSSLWTPPSGPLLLLQPLSPPCPMGSP